MWERVLVVGVTSGLASNDNPYLRIVGLNEQGRDRVWFAFGNERVLGRPVRDRMTGDEYERVVVFSNTLHLLLAAAAHPVHGTLEEYARAVRTPGHEAQAVDLERELEEIAREITGDVDLQDDSIQTAAVAEKVGEHIIGRVVMVDWNPDASRGRGGPASHALPYLPDTTQVKPSTVFAGRQVRTHLRRFAERTSYNANQAFDEARKALAEAPDLVTNIPIPTSPSPSTTETDDDSSDDLF